MIEQNNPANSDRAKEVLLRINDARADRDTHAPRANEFYEVCSKYRRRVSSTLAENTPESGGSKQSDCFDQTAQIELQNFASDMVDYFTPQHKAWATIAEVEGASEATVLAAGDEADDYLKKLFKGIRSSNFYAASQQSWEDLAGGAAGIFIPFKAAYQSICCTAIPMANLLIDCGPDGRVDGRWYEFWTRGRKLKNIFNFKIPKKYQAKQWKNKKVRVVQGCYRDWSVTNEVVWKWDVFFFNDHAHESTLRGAGSCPIIVKRWNPLPDSAWGPGPGDNVVAAARTLDELGYINLKRLGKQADPPITYDQDGVFNPDIGVEAGTFLPRRPGTRSNFDFMIPPGDGQDVYFDREDLRQVVKQALYQDKPSQSGDTPPSATQWLDERAQNDRRLAIIRSNLYNDWTLQIMQRFAYIMQRRGELPMNIIVGEKEFPVEFDSALQRASDIEEVQRARDLLQLMVGLLGESAMASINAKETAENIQAKLGDDLVVIIEPSEQDEVLQTALREGRNLIREQGAPSL
jgi:hypothetical protein